MIVDAIGYQHTGDSLGTQFRVWCMIQRMRVALMNGVVGLALTFWVGMEFLQMSPDRILLCILAIQISGLITVLTTLQSEQVGWMRRNFLNRSMKTWAFFIGLYLGISMLISPELRKLHTWLWLFVPLLLTNGFTCVFFGPIQDQIVRRRQRRSQLTAAKAR